MNHWIQTAGDPKARPKFPTLNLILPNVWIDRAEHTVRSLKQLVRYQGFKEQPELSELKLRTNLLELSIVFMYEDVMLPRAIMEQINEREISSSGNRENPIVRGGT